MAGGVRDIALDDANMLKAAAAGFEQLKKASNSLKPLELARESLQNSIVDAKVQVVSGLKYFITIDLRTGNSVARHEIQMWSQPWTKTLKLVGHTLVRNEDEPSN
jgi:hypothetical protein